MEKRSFFLILLILLIVAFSFLYQEYFIKTNSFTEIYFSNPELIPKVLWMNYTYNFSFELKSHELAEKNYFCYIDSDLVDFNKSIILFPNESKYFEIFITPKKIGKYNLTINLDYADKHQEIFFKYTVE